MGEERKYNMILHGVTKNEIDEVHERLKGLTYTVSTEPVKPRHMGETTFKTTLEQLSKKACLTCKQFETIAGMSGEGICHKGHGYTEKTAQGLPKPKQGDAYRMYYDVVCEEDYQPTEATS